MTLYTNQQMVDIIEDGTYTADMQFDSSSKLQDVSLFTDEAEYIHLNPNHSHLCNSGKTFFTHGDDVTTIIEYLSDATYVVLNWCNDQGEVFKKEDEQWKRVQIINHFDEGDILSNLPDDVIIRYVTGLLTPEEKAMFEDLEKSSDDIQD